MNDLSTTLGSRTKSVQKKSTRRLMVENKRNRKTSYVWHYFECLGDTARCRVCQHVTYTKRGNTSSMIWHLENVHALKNREHVKLSALPTLSRRSPNIGACMRNRVLDNFENVDGTWLCKLCDVTFQARKTLPMIEHLTTTHWGTNKLGNINGERDVGTDTDAVDDRPNHAQENMMNNSIFGDLMDRLIVTDSENYSNNCGDLKSDTPLRNSKDLDGSYKIKINLPDGNEVEGFVVGSVDNSRREVARGQSAVNLDHNYHDESRTVSPIVTEDRHQKDDLIEPQVPLVDNRRRFDHQYSRRSSKRNVLATSERIKKQNRSLPVRIKTKSIRIQNTNTQELDIQVPLENVQDFSAKVEYERDGKSSIYLSQLVE